MGTRAAELSLDRLTMVGILYAACLVCTVPALFLPGLRELFAADPWTFPWQPVTAAFSHGFAGLPPLLHLVANSFLFFTVGVWAERLVGTARFAALTAAALAAFVAVQAGLGVRVNGSSVFLYAYGPVAFVAWRAARRRPARRHEVWGQVAVLLAVMYLAITGMMAAFVYLAGFRGNPLIAFLEGNLFHLVATAAGVPFALAWRRRIGARLGRIEGPFARRRRALAEVAEEEDSGPATTANDDSVPGQATTADRLTLVIGSVGVAFLAAVVVAVFAGLYP